MPQLPLPNNGAVVPAAGDLPVTGDGDVHALLPSFVRTSDSAPVRDALIAALREILLRYQSTSPRAAGQCDIARATGAYLDRIAEERGVFRQAGEADRRLRARVLTGPELVTPTALLAAANAVLAPHTKVQAEYAESILDRWYVHDGTASWHSFVGANPHYPARLYPEAAASNGGAFRPNSRIGGAWAFADRLGRAFVLRVPVLTSLGRAHAFVPRAFATNGATASRAGFFVFRDTTNAVAVYQAIVNAIERIKAHSIRWTLVADPRLGV